MEHIVETSLLPNLSKGCHKQHFYGTANLTPDLNRNWIRPVCMTRLLLSHFKIGYKLDWDVCSQILCLKTTKRDTDFINFVLSIHLILEKQCKVFLLHLSMATHQEAQGTCLMPSICVSHAQALGSNLHTQTSQVSVSPARALPSCTCWITPASHNALKLFPD